MLARRLQLSALRRDGQEFPVELSINQLPGAGKKLFVGFIRDITDRHTADEALRQAKEDAEAASRAKDHFLAALSHELRTPLTPALMSVAVLRRDERLSAEVREELGMIERNIGLEARLIDDLLDLTRIARGKLQLHKELCDLHSLLAHAVQIVSSEARARDVAIHVDCGATHSGLSGDPARLQQVFWNLLKNAVKFTPSGGRVEVHTRDDDSSGRFIVEVSDTGIGFAPDSAESIFQPFERAAREGDHRFGGLGLGLAIVRAIVDLHGGAIRATSQGAGQGATFTVELPGATDPPSGLTENIIRDAPVTESRSLQLLVVEDHEPTLAVLTRLLGRAGHQTVSVNSVADALKAVKSQQFDVVISDLGLPDGSGWDLIAELRAHNPDIRGIALTGYGMEDDLVRSRAAGFTTHLVKPVEFDQLRRALNELSRKP